MFILEIALCTGQKGQVKVTGTLQETHNGWAQYADRLLLGQDLLVEIPGAPKGSHPVQVSLYETSDLDTNIPPRLEVSVFRSCKDLHPASSSAKQPKIYIPKSAAV